MATCPHCKTESSEAKKHCQNPGCGWRQCTVCHAVYGRWNHTHKDHAHNTCPGRVEQKPEAKP